MQVKLQWGLDDMGTLTAVAAEFDPYSGLDALDMYGGQNCPGQHCRGYRSVREIERDHAKDLTARLNGKTFHTGCRIGTCRRIPAEAHLDVWGHQRHCWGEYYDLSRPHDGGCESDGSSAKTYHPSLRDYCRPSLRCHYPHCSECHLPACELCKSNRSEQQGVATSLREDVEHAKAKAAVAADHGMPLVGMPQVGP